jgi:hypothetical protein
MSIEAPKPLDDQRLQGLFSDAISGALAFGAQNTNPPPAGHWLERFWQMGRAERALSEAAPPAAKPVAWQERQQRSPTEWSYWYEAGSRHRPERSATIDGIGYELRPLYTAAPAVPQTEPVLDHDGLIAAHRTLVRLGYTWLGGELWKPPLGKRASPQTEKDAARLRDLLNEADDEAAEERVGDAWERAADAWAKANPNNLRGFAEWQHQMRAAIKAAMATEQPK